jgi:phytoene/squalene synthetase
MPRINVEHLREAVGAAREAIQHANFDACDSGDLEEILDPVERELDATDPNPQTLSTYLNSLARSLRAEPATREALRQLDAAMRESGVPTQWEH